MTPTGIMKEDTKGQPTRKQKVCKAIEGLSIIGGAITFLFAALTMVFQLIGKLMGWKVDPKVGFYLWVYAFIVLVLLLPLLMVVSNPQKWI